MALNLFLLNTPEVVIAHGCTSIMNIPIAIVTSEASYHVAYDWGSVAFLRQAGCKVELIRLAEHDIRGNAHFMMMENDGNLIHEPTKQLIQELLKNLVDFNRRISFAPA